MPENEIDINIIRDKFAEDDEIIREVRSDSDLLTEIRYRILIKKLHNQLMDLIEDAIENERVQINSVADLLDLIELDLMLS